MKVLTFDFETYYDTKAGYTLRKMSTEDYVSDERFELIGCSVMIDDKPVGHLATDDEAQMTDWLWQFDIESMALAGHHLMFDGLILAKKFKRFPAFYACTESMVRPFLKPLLKSLSLASVAHYLGLGEKGTEVILADGKRLRDFTPAELAAYMAYCDKDVGLTRGIFNWARPQLPSTEMRLIDMTLRMYLQPQLILDPKEYRAGLKAVRERKAAIMEQMELQGTTGEKLRSKDQFAQLLRDRGIEPPMKDSPTSIKKGEVPPKRTYAFSKNDPEFIDLREEYSDDLAITMLLNARVSEMGSIEETRNATLLFIAEERGHYRVPLSYYAAHTGRYAGKTDRDRA